MLKIDVPYTDFDGNKQVETLYFNISAAELTEMDMLENGTMQDRLQAIIDSEDGKQLVPAFKDIVRRAYGVRSEDGKRFRKSESLSDDFESSAVYSEFFMRLVTDAKFSSDFINNILPADLSEQAERAQARREANMTPSEIARARSEERMQGHKKPEQKVEPNPAPAIEQVETPEEVSEPVSTEEPTTHNVFEQNNEGPQVSRGSFQVPEDTLEREEFMRLKRDEWNQS